ncbi:MAG: hypothetical protein IPN11_11535 [Opitutaceae bacterium]|nr:hypothetical protein [Opitutaceae bacterium]
MTGLGHTRDRQPAFVRVAGERHAPAGKEKFQSGIPALFNLTEFGQAGDAEVGSEYLGSAGGVQPGGNRGIGDGLPVGDRVAARQSDAGVAGRSPDYR